jgi:cold shock CspA family protein
MHGEMLWFDEKKDFGFILTQDEERLYVHRSGFLPGEVPVGRCARTKVSFEREVRDLDGVAHAVSVSQVEEAAPRRARRRHGHR